LNCLKFSKLGRGKVEPKEKERAVKECGGEAAAVTDNSGGRSFILLQRILIS
jgi:hypothetical protein